MIFESFESITPTENHIKQLHSVLLKYSEKDQDHRRAITKKVPNHVEAFGPDGKSLGVVRQETEYEKSVIFQNALSPADSHLVEVELDARSLQRTHSHNAVVAHIVAPGCNDAKCHLMVWKVPIRSFPEIICVNRRFSGHG